MSARTEQLRQIIFTKPSVCPERARYLTESYQETEGSPILLRRAKAFEKVLSKMTVFIQPNELIVGNFASRPRGTPIFPEFSVDWVNEELDDLEKRPLEAFLISDQTKKPLRRSFKYWSGKTHLDKARGLIEWILPSELLKVYDFESFTLNQVVTNVTCMTGGNGHVTPDYKGLLSKGLQGVLNEAKEHLKILSPIDHENQKKILFLKAVMICCQSAIQFAERFSTEAARLAKAEKDPKRKSELKKIAKSCSYVPANPPRTFWEALQFCWFIHLLIQIESNGHSISLGRMDQYLYPFYRNDIEKGLLTQEEAIELIECFFIKCNEILKLHSWSTTQYKSGFSGWQALTLGGQLSNGEDASNELSYIFLKALGNARLTNPTVTVSINSNTSEIFVAECCKTLLKHGGGMPGFFNGDLAISLLLKNGINLEDARNWSVTGCSEPAIPGKSSPLCAGATYLNFPKILEIALNNGTNPNNGVCLCPGDGFLTDFGSFDALKHAYKRQLRFYIKFAPLFDAITASTYAELTPTPFLSAALTGRIENGKDITELGEPNYNIMISLGHGMANIGDALAAIKKLVFDEKIITLSELKHELDTDFQGIQGERIRQLLLNYGNIEPTRNY